MPPVGRREKNERENVVTVQIRPVQRQFVAEVEGIDLSKPVDDATLLRLRRALADHSVLVFRGQTLTEAEHIAFSRRFGELDIHTATHYLLPDFPEILVLSNRGEKGTTPVENGGAYWHTDVSYKPRPPLGSLLYALEVPPVGGDTLYADMFSAYDTLSEATKLRVAGLKAVHRYADRYRTMQQSGKRPPLTAAQLANVPDVVHPVVRTHPENGRKALYVNEGFTVGIQGMPEKEGRALLDELCRHATQDAFVYAHKWRQGDLVFWDNRSTQHRATSYDVAYVRAMHRTTVAGQDVPA